MYELRPEQIYDEAKRQWGAKPQILAAIEELSETAAVLARFSNDKCESIHEVITELADAEIMLEQMKLYFPKGEIEAEKRRKLARLAARLGLT